MLQSVQSEFYKMESEVDNCGEKYQNWHDRPYFVTAADQFVPTTATTDRNSHLRHYYENLSAFGIVQHQDEFVDRSTVEPKMLDIFSECGYCCYNNNNNNSTNIEPIFNYEFDVPESPDSLASTAAAIGFRHQNADLSETMNQQVPQISIKCRTSDDHQSINSHLGNLKKKLNILLFEYLNKLNLN